MARFYADENFDKAVVIRLRAFGHDAVTVQEAGRRGKDDGDVLAYATQDGRIVLTHNRRDFAHLHRASADHTGIISCTLDDDPAALAMRINDTIAQNASLARTHVRVNLPP